MLHYATKYVRAPGAQPRRVESIGFAGLAAALATVRSMSEVAEPGTAWLVTTKVDGAHVPAVVGSGSGAATLIAAGVYHLDAPDVLTPPAAI